MKTLWQLRKLSTNESLNEPQLLPENWGPIFGMEGYKDKLGDLSWVGIEDQGWFEVGPAPDDMFTSKEREVLDIVQARLVNSDWAVLPDVPITSEEKAKWIEYRRLLREVKRQPRFPLEIEWPFPPK